MASSSSGTARPEFAFIDWVRDRVTPRPEVRLGIGDDAALLTAEGREWVTAVDMLCEGTHFDAQTSPELIGRKALNVNISDMAAMAAEPCTAFIGIALPRSREREYAEQLYQGLFDAAAEFGISIAGGDTNSWDGPLVISVTLMGLATSRGVVTRTGAQPGDWIFVTGTLGGSLTTGRHLEFTPRVREALALHAAVELHAMLDISDGLASDLFHLLDAGGVGATLSGENIPIHSDLSSEISAEKRLQHALNDGEDFELLFTVDPETGAQLLAEGLPMESSEPLTLWKIGEIDAQPGARIVTRGLSQELPRGGWVHQF